MRKLLLFVACCAVAGIAACAEESPASLGIRRGSRNTTTETDPTEATAGQTTAEQKTAEEEAFAKVEPDMLKNCGRTCHDTGVFSGAPVFLKGPDVYASIKNQPGVVVRDVFASTILTKGPHAGPAVSSLPDFEKLVIEWLETEAVAIQSQKLPTSAPATVTIGENDVDLSPASNGKLTNVRLKFKAELVGTMLSLTNVRLSAPAGTDVHIVQPKFVRVTEGGSGSTPPEDIEDPADSFSNSDQTIAGGQEAVLSPGSVLFSAPAWRPFDSAKDKIRIEVTKLEPGKVAVIANAPTCADPAGFATKVLPTMRTTQANGQTCAQCHGAGLAGLNLASNDASLVCNQVLGKLSKGDIPNSLIVKKVTGATHSGGAVADANAWRTLFTANSAVFFK